LVSQRRVSLVGIIAIAGIEFYALAHGVNGVALATSIGAIAGLAGFSVGRVTRKDGDN